MKLQMNLSPAPPNLPNNQQGVKVGGEEHEDLQEETEEEGEEVKVPVQGEVKGQLYQETLKMAIIPTTSKPQMASCKDQSMDFHFVITVEDQVTKDRTVQ